MVKTKVKRPPSTASRSRLRLVRSRTSRPSSAPLVSVVMPCLNEEEAIGACIQKIQSTFESNGLKGEIIVVDNGSTDRSAEIARNFGATVVEEPNRGYGRAYLRGFAAAKGRYLVMGDADDTYDFSKIPDFLAKLQQGGFDFVTGSRYLESGAAQIPLLHRLVGNPMLTALLNGLFGTSYSDVYCGFRGFSREAYRKIRPVSPGMEFNLELAINAGLAGLKVAEIPIELGARKGESKLRTFRDGWRSLRMMLLYCPNKVFMWPGFFLFFVGMLLHAARALHVLPEVGPNADEIQSYGATLASILGFSILNLGLHARSYSWSRRYDDNRFLTRFYQKFKLETGLLLGTLGALVGFSVVGTLAWLSFQTQSPVPYFKELMPIGATLAILGVNTIFASLFISAMSMKANEENRRG